ncbi:MAG TPA: helix-turn-helix domain-containing protein, partial [Gemmatimonadaceae bacterium]|nr:helix-turn-helix domain-containing protein [Gemmatimonadaceae bacterium]
MTTGRMHVAASTYGPGTRHEPHAHDDLQISVVLRGEVEERVGPHVERAAALSVVVKDPRVTHADRFGAEGALIVRLSARGGGLADLVDDPSRALPWRWTHDPAVAAPFLRIAERGARGERAFAVDDDDVTDLIAALSARAAPLAAGATPAWLVDAVRSIDEGWRPGLTVRDVACAARVHPVYLARCVRRWHGVSAGDLVRRARLRHAAREVAARRVTVSAIAHALGYADEP